MPARKRNTADRLLVGWVIGIVVPLVFFLAFYQMKYSEMPFMVYLRNVWDMKIFLKIISLCVFPNLGFFFLFYRKKYDMAARGVIMATFMYAFLVLVAKLI
ncbi:MAG: hypothetical protein PHP53_21640 [Prolixibacteraceae bacterium]|nr:hypothetical protein [Prolixibacteraceae bacterium]